MINQELEFVQDDPQQYQQGLLLGQTYPEYFWLNSANSTFDSGVTSTTNNLTVSTNFCTHSDRGIEFNKTTEQISDCKKNLILFNTDFRFEISAKNDFGNVIDWLNVSSPFGIFENLQNPSATQSC